MRPWPGIPLPPHPTPANRKIRFFSSTQRTSLCNVSPSIAPILQSYMDFAATVLIDLSKATLYIFQYHLNLWGGWKEFESCHSRDIKHGTLFFSGKLGGNAPNTNHDAFSSPPIKFHDTGA